MLVINLLVGYEGQWTKPKGNIMNYADKTQNCDNLARHKVQEIS